MPRLSLPARPPPRPAAERLAPDHAQRAQRRIARAKLRGAGTGTRMLLGDAALDGERPPG